MIYVAIFGSGAKRVSREGDLMSTTILGGKKSWKEILFLCVSFGSVCVCYLQCWSVSIA